MTKKILKDVKYFAKIVDTIALTTKNLEKYCQNSHSVLEDGLYAFVVASNPYIMFLRTAWFLLKNAMVDQMSSFKDSFYYVLLLVVHS